VASTLARALPSVPPGLGLGTCFNAVPLQCRMSVFPTLPLGELPAAQALVGEMASTLARVLPFVPAGLRLGTRFHAVPFQCSIRFWDWVGSAVVL
jgi:hypothetical protein